MKQTECNRNYKKAFLLEQKRCEILKLERDIAVKELERLTSELADPQIDFINSSK